VRERRLSFLGLFLLFFLLSLFDHLLWVFASNNNNFLCCVLRYLSYSKLGEEERKVLHRTSTCILSYNFPTSLLSRGRLEKGRKGHPIAKCGQARG